MNWDLCKNYFSPIVPFLEDPSVGEIMCNSFNEIYIERNGVAELTDSKFSSDLKVLDAIDIFAKTVGDESFGENGTAEVKGKLWDGSRFQGMRRPYSRFNSFVIRVAPKTRLKLFDLVSKKALSLEMANYLINVIKLGGTIVFSGGTNSGKTTLLNALAEYIPEVRISVVEDSSEIVLKQKNVTFFECDNDFSSSSKLVKTFTLSDGIFVCMRFNPDRILIGEIRSPSAGAAFLTSINSGHTGTMTTTHAKDPDGALTKLAMFAASEDLPLVSAKYQIYRYVDVVVQINSIHSVGKFVTHIAETRDGELKTIFEIDDEYLFSPNISNLEKSRYKTC